MKTELTAFDLHFLARELQSLIGAFLDKIYVLEDRNVLVTFGNKQLLQAAPGRLWMPPAKPETPGQIHPFAAQARKLIGNSKVAKIEQVCSERILAIRTTRSDKLYTLYLEIFGRGNAVLCDGSNIVLAALARNERATPKQAYKLPDSIDTFHLNEHDFAVRFAQSTDNVSKTLAVQFGLGKVLAEELCVRTGVSAMDKATPAHAKDIYPALQKLLEQPLKPQLIFDESILIDAVPVPLDCYANKRRENVEHFGTALARVFALPAAAAKEQKISPVTQQLKKIETMIALQKQNLAKLEQQATDEHKKGEWLYEHYQEVKQLLADITEARKTLGWKEIKQKFPKIKELNEATGDITVEF